MAHIKRENKMPPLEELSVYAIFNLNQDAVFVWTAQKGNLRRNFSNHYNLRYLATKELFAEARDQGVLPEIYLLEDVVCVKKLAYNHCVAWARYFRDHGFAIIPYRQIEVFCEDLSERQQKLYDDIKDIVFWDLCSTNTVLFRDYGQPKEKKIVRNKHGEVVERISVPVSSELYDLIRRAAAANRQSINAFCRDRILNGETIYVDFDFAQPYVAEMEEDRELLRQILYAIYTRRCYLPRDIENIQKLVNDILANAHKVDNAFKEYVRELKKNQLGEGK